MDNSVFDNLYNIFRENKFSHAYLFETNDIEGCYLKVKELIKKIICEKDYTEKCAKCELCHLVDENLLPSIITIEPDGKKIKKEAIEDLKKAFSLMPTYIPYNIYIIKYPEKMNDTAFNKMLKFLEEPEDNILGFYITDNKDNIASTIISRCEVLKYFPGNNNTNFKANISEEEYNSVLEIIDDYFNKIEKKDKNILWYNSTVVLKTLPSHEQIVCLLNLIYNKYVDLFKKDMSRCTLKKMKIVAKYLEQLNYNVNSSLLLDSFAIEIGDIDER